MRGRILALYFMCFMGGTPVGAPLIGWISERFGAPWGLIGGGIVCIVVSTAAGAVLARGRRVRLEMHVVPPSVQLHVAAAGGAARTRAEPPERVAGLAEAADGEVPGEQVAGPSR
jgi:MFS family permease